MVTFRWSSPVAIKQQVPLYSGHPPIVSRLLYPNAGQYWEGSLYITLNTESSAKQGKHSLNHFHVFTASLIRNFIPEISNNSTKDVLQTAILYPARDDSPNYPHGDYHYRYLSHNETPTGRLKSYKKSPVTRGVLRQDWSSPQMPFSNKALLRLSDLYIQYVCALINTVLVVFAR